MVEMVNDDPSAFSREAFVAAYRDCDDEKMEEIRARVDSLVADDATADALKPWYRQLCKRPCFHDEYLQSYNNPNTRLIDTDGKGVTEITPTGVVVGDTHYELDCLVFASGFEVGTTYARRSGFETTGRDGLTLTEHWAADGMRRCTAAMHAPICRWAFRQPDPNGRTPGRAELAAMFGRRRATSRGRRAEQAWITG